MHKNYNPKTIPTYISALLMILINFSPKSTKISLNQLIDIIQLSLEQTREQEEKKEITPTLCTLEIFNINKDLPCSSYYTFYISSAFAGSFTILLQNISHGMTL